MEQQSKTEAEELNAQLLLKEWKNYVENYGCTTCVVIWLVGIMSITLLFTQVLLERLGVEKFACAGFVWKNKGV